MPEEFHTVIPRSFEACKETILYDLHFTHPLTAFTFTNQLSVMGAAWGKSYFISDQEFRVEMQGVDLVIEGVLAPLQEDSTEVTGQVNPGGQCIKFNILVPFGWTAMLAVVFYISKVSLLFLLVLAPIFLAAPFAFCHLITAWYSRWIIRDFIESLEAES
jgi:hypothetical protein